jgi:hypothetical protein
MKEQPKDKFPITVKKGHASVKIYRVKNREALYYCVSYVGPQGRQRRNFADLAVAKREANNSAQHLADGDMEAFKLRAGKSKSTSKQSGQLRGLDSRCIQSLTSSPERSTS